MSTADTAGATAPTVDYPPAACLACGGHELERVADLGTGPAFVGASWPDGDRARGAPRGRLDLWLCPRCGHVANRAFDPTVLDYDGHYDNSLHHSATFQDYADELVGRLVGTYGIRHRRVVEIGAGKGEFLTAICRFGANTGTGFDPTCQAGTPAPGVRMVSEYYRPGDDLQPYALLVCRHVLEHLDDPAATLRSIRERAPADAVLYFEVPAAEFNFGPEGLWDCIYPHVSYFCAASLRSLLGRCGFEVLDCGRSFAGQFLWVEARPGAVVDEPVPAGQHLDLVRDFGRSWRATVAEWREQITERDRSGEDMVLWGAGAKGVTFLNAVDRSGRLSVVDVNPRKQGGYLAGTGHYVGSPDSLARRRVTSVFITNPVYATEIGQQLRDLGVDAAVVTV